MSFSPKPPFYPMLVCQDSTHLSRPTLNPISLKELFLISFCLSSTTTIDVCFILSYSNPLVQQFMDQDLGTWVSSALPHNTFLKIIVSPAGTWHRILCTAKHTLTHAFIELIFVEHHLYTKSNARECHTPMNKIDIVAALIKLVILWSHIDKKTSVSSTRS